MMSNKLPRQSLAPRLIREDSLTPQSPAKDDGLTQSKVAGASAATRRISSRALLGDTTSLVIDHEGVSYVLRATRLGKLILTK